MKKRMVSAAATFAATTLLAVGVPGAAHADDSRYGCPRGYVCMYAEGRTLADLGSPVLEFYSYGAHNLSHVYGYHTLVNNQWGTATFDVCDGWNGTQCEGLTGLGTLGMDFTPINSVVLIP